MNNVLTQRATSCQRSIHHAGAELETPQRVRSQQRILRARLGTGCGVTMQAWSSTLKVGRMIGILHFRHHLQEIVGPEVISAQ